MLMTGAKVANVKSEYENQQTLVYQPMLSVFVAERLCIALSMEYLFIHNLHFGYNRTYFSSFFCFSLSLIRILSCF